MAIPCHEKNLNMCYKICLRWISVENVSYTFIYFD
jgi:hypothetical protein